jgi:hypothetical protein
MPSFVEQALQSAFPGRLYLSPGEALSLVPGAPPSHPENAAYQRILRGTFPFPTRLVGGRRVVSIWDIARSVTDEMAPPASQRRGRPRKIAGGVP